MANYTISRIEVAVNDALDYDINYKSGSNPNLPIKHKHYLRLEKNVIMCARSRQHAKT